MIKTQLPCTAVLIIESDPERADLARVAMAGDGAANISVEVAANLATGLELLKKDFKAVLLNLRLADSEGMETLRKVRGHFASKRIFVMSESKDSRMAEMVKESGPAEVISRTALGPHLLQHASGKTPPPSRPHSDRDFASHWVRSFFNATTDAAAIVCDGMIQLANGRFRKLVGLEPEDNCSARSLKEFIHPDDLASLGAVDGENDSVTSSTVHASTTRVASGSGTWKTADVWRIGSGDAKDRRTILVFREERKQKKRDLAARHHASVLDMMSDGIAAITLHGDILSWNEGAERIYGHPASDVMGHKISLLLSPSQSLEIEMVLHKARMGEQTVRFETVGVRRGGNTFPCSIAVLPSFDEEGKVIDATIVVREIQDQWRLDAQFRQANKMEAIGQLAGGIAHDFNNLLGVISGYAELLEVQLGQKDSAVETCKKIRTTTDRAAGLVTQLLAFSRQQLLEPTIVSLNAIVSDTAEIVRHMVGEDIEIATFLQDNLSTIRADEVQLQQVIMNLAVNARDAMPNGGVLRLQTDDVTVDSDFAEKNPPILCGKYVRLRATDNGHGIDSETKPHVFEPFFTTKERGKGTGLGLATVYGIVKQSGGYIWVDSTVGNGTTFSIYLPVVGGSTSTSNRRIRAKVEARTSHPGGTILILEDDPSMLEIISRFLESDGYNVLPTGTAAEALKTATEHDGYIDLFLTDIVMPGMNGPRAAERILHTRPTTRILFVSGHSNDKICGILANHRTRVFVQKPFTRRVLIERVRKALDARGTEVHEDFAGIN